MAGWFTQTNGFQNLVVIVCVLSIYIIYVSFCTYVFSCLNLFVFSSRRSEVVLSCDWVMILSNLTAL